MLDPVSLRRPPPGAARLHDGLGVFVEQIGLVPDPNVVLDPMSKLHDLVPAGRAGQPDAEAVALAAEAGT